MANPQDIQKLKEFFSKPLEETTFKKGDKVTYLGHPGVITGVNKEMTGATTYNVAYDKGNGRTKVSNLSNKGGEIKLAETKPLGEAIETPMDAITFLNANRDRILSIAKQHEGDALSMQRALDNFLAPHLEGTPEFVITRLKAAIGSAISKRNISADPELSATYDTLKNVKGLVRENNVEDFKPYVVKDRNNPNFLKVFIQYPTGTGFTTALGQRTMTGQDRDYGAAKAMQMGQAVAAKLNSKYNIEDIEVSDNEAGKVIVFAVSDDFIKMNTPLIDEAEEKYTVAGRPVTLNKGKKTDGTDWTVTFENGKSKSLADVLSLIKPMPKGITMNEAKKEDAVDTITMDVPLFLRILEYSREDAQKDIDLHDVTDKAISLGKERGILSMEDYEEIVGTAEEIKELKGKYMPQDKLEALDMWISDMLKYKKPEEVKQIILSKLKGNLNDNTKELTEGLKDELIDLLTSRYGLKFQLATGIGALIVNLAQRPEMVSKLLSMVGLNENQEELTEANVPSNIAEFAKRKGVSSLVNKVAGWAEKVGARIAGGTAVGKNYSTLVLDLDYKQQGEIRIDTDEETVTLYDEPVYDFKSFQRVYIDGADNNLEEGEEEQLSFISPARAKSSLRQFLSGKRDDGMGKFDAIVYGIDSDGNKHQIKYYNHLQDYEKFALGDNPDIVKEGMRGELDEPFFIEVSVRDARKALDLFQDQYRNSNVKMYGSNVYAADTPEYIYDLYYDLTSQDIEILDANVEDEDFNYDSEYEKTLRETIKFIKESKPEATTEEVISELKEIKALGEQLNEELCPAGKAYIKRRQAAGEKSSAYLSGRGVKVCKGQMSGRKKKK